MTPHLSQRLLSTGSNARGQLALNHSEDAHTFSPALFLSSPSSSHSPEPPGRITALACGGNHTLALIVPSPCQGGKAQVWGAGDSSDGQLGLPSSGSEVFVPLPLSLSPELEGYTPTHIAAAWSTSYIVLRPPSPTKSDVLLTLGSSSFGLRGPSPSPPSTPTRLDLLPALPPETTHYTITPLAASPRHAILSLLAFSPHSPDPTPLTLGLGASRKSQLSPSLSHAPFLSAPAVLPIPFAPAKIAAGREHSLFLPPSSSPGEEVVAWGSDARGQLRLPERRARQVQASWNGSYVLDFEGRVWACGSNTHGQLGRRAMGEDTPGPVALPRPAREIAVGSEHLLVLLSSPSSPSLLALSTAAEDEREEGPDEIYVFGWNEHGTLGLGHTEDVWVPERAWPPVEEAWRGWRVRGMWGGCGSSWVLVEEGRGGVGRDGGE